MESEQLSVLEQLELALDDVTVVSLSQLLKQVNESSSREDPLAFEMLAKISIKKRDIETGLYCASKLRMARVCRDVRNELKDCKGPSSALSLLALNFNLLDEAEAILVEADDKVALSNFYQETNQWEKAIECIDRLNLKNVYYKYAKYLESEGNFHEAVKYYEKSNTNTFEVPRMLFDLDDGNNALRKYCMSNRRPSLSSSGTSEQVQGRQSKQADLMRWWGQYSESIGDVAEALVAYEKAKDYYNYVRLLCFTGDMDAAKKAVADNHEEDKEPDVKRRRDAGRLFLAKQLEQSNPSEAIELFVSCRAIRQALRVCRANDLLNDLVKITVEYGSSDEAADLLRQHGGSPDISPESIVRLYQKAGQTRRAIEVAIEHRSWLQLREIVNQEIEATSAQEKRTSISEESVDLVIQALRDDNGIIDIAIDLLLLTKSDQISLIEKLLTDYNLEIRDELIEKIEKISKQRGENESLIRTVAELALRQSRYATAAKLFNSIGDRIHSIEAMIRSPGDNTEKIIRYANICRDKSVFRIAGNFLQTINYTDSGTIRNFYKKAGAQQELDRFESTQ